MNRRSDGRWLKVVTVRGKRLYFYSTADTESKAEKDIRKQILQYKGKQESRYTFSVAADEWADEHFEHCENNTLKVYRPALKAAKEYFSHALLNDISGIDIEGYISSLTNQGYAKKTVKNRLLVVSLIFKYAVQNRLCETNPCVNISIPRNLPQTKRDGASAEDIEKIKNGIGKSEACFFAAFLIYTGLRRGEALALRYTDIAGDSVSVDKTLEWVGNVPQLKNHTKTEKGERKVPLPPIILNEIKKRKKDGLIFAGADEGYMHNAAVTRLIGRYQRELGITLTPHQLRHGYATILYDAGIDLKTAQAWMGHANIQTTMDIYTHISEERNEAQKDRLKQYLEAQS